MCMFDTFCISLRTPCAVITVTDPKGSAHPSLGSLGLVIRLAYHSGVEGGGQTHPQNMSKSMKIWAKSLKIWAKMAPNVVSLKKWRHLTFAEKQIKTFFASHTKKVGKSRTKFFGQVWKNFGKNPSYPQNLPAPTPMAYQHQFLRVK